MSKTNLRRALGSWPELFLAIWDERRGHPDLLSGQDVHEWVAYLTHDYDEIDRFYIEHETIGGG